MYRTLPRRLRTTAEGEPSDLRTVTLLQEGGRGRRTEVTIAEGRSILSKSPFPYPDPQQT